MTRFGIELKELLSKNTNELNEEQKIFLKYYNKHLPVIETNCVMNKICKYIENIDFNIKKKVRSNQDFDYKTLQTNNFILNNTLYRQIKEELEKTFKEWDLKRKEEDKKNLLRKNATKDDEKIKFEKDIETNLLKNKLLEICSNEEKLANHLIYYFYEERPSSSKNTLWSLVGKQIYENLKLNINSYYFPIKNPNGNLKFLYENYSIEKIDIESEDN